MVPEAFHSQTNLLAAKSAASHSEHLILGRRKRLSQIHFEDGWGEAGSTVKKLSSKTPQLQKAPGGGCRWQAADTLMCLILIWEPSLLVLLTHQFSHPFLTFLFKSPLTVLPKQAFLPSQPPKGLNSWAQPLVEASCATGRPLLPKAGVAESL